MFNNRAAKRFFCVDNFYKDPYAVRKFALAQEFVESDYHKGKRTTQQFLFKGLKERFEQIMGETITEWESHGMCGRFQYCTPDDPLVYHCDNQRWAAAIYLTPNAPYDTGTSFFAHKETGLRHKHDPDLEKVFNTGYYLDKTPYETVDTVGNVFNRLVIWDGRLLHCPTQYFGFNKENSRLFQIFFFD